MIIHEPTPIPPEWIHRITYCPPMLAGIWLDYSLDRLEIKMDIVNVVSIKEILYTP